MNNRFVKLFLPYIIGTVVLALFSMVYFSPAAFDGKTLGQSDVVQATGSQAEILKYNKSEGHEMLWSNGMFGGMPTFQVYNSGGETYNYLQKFVYNWLKLGQSVTSSYGLLFAACFGFFLLMMTLKIDWRLGLVGAILYGLSTSHMILIEAGHVNKMYVLAFLAPTLAGILLIFQGKYLWGAAVTALFTSLQVFGNHPQITYYFFLLIGILGIAKAVDAVREGQIGAWSKSIATLVVAVVIGVLPNIVKLWSTYEYAKHSIRGKNEITTDEKKAGDDGLTKEYAFGWSLGKAESFSLIAANYMGNGESFVSDESSATFSALTKMPEKQAQQLAQGASTYWGEQPFTTGNVYYGAALMLLFFLGFYSLKDSLKWWSLASLLFLVMISWGKHFAVVNYLLFDYFPMFNKFRSVNMANNLGHVIVVAIGMLGLQRFIWGEESKEEKQKNLIWAVGTIASLLVVALVYGWTSSLAGPNDEQIGKASPQLLNALMKDRAALLQSDVLRSLFFVLASAAALWFANKQEKVGAMSWVFAGLTLVLSLFDVVGVSKRYLSSEDFKTSRSVKQYSEPRAVDKQIQQDKDLSYRVLDLTGNPFSNAVTSNFHKSMGGYHAVKLMIYQDMIERYLGNPQEALDIYGMFNTKYVITEQGQTMVAVPLEQACGNAWFVPSFQLVENATEELDSLKNLKPKVKAILQKANAKNLDGFTVQYDTTNSIKMTKYIPDAMTYTYNAKSDQLAMFSEVYYADGWNVYIDGKLLENAIMRANYAIRAVKVPAGQHTLEMKFEPVSYIKGQQISRIGSILLTLLFFAGLFFWWKEENGRVGE